MPILQWLVDKYLASKTVFLISLFTLILLIYLFFQLMFSASNVDNNADLPFSDPQSENFVWKGKKVINELHKAFLNWEGTPYLLGGTSKSGCSAFVQAVYQSAFSIQLPRTTELQSKQGSQISIKNIRAGDLVFFNSSAKLKHVGIYLKENKFIHASTSKGVITTSLANPHWADKIWQIRRMLDN